MVLLPFHKKVVEANPQVFDLVESSFLSQAVYYVINSKFRTSVKVTSWIKEQVENPTQEVLDFVNSIPTKDSYDAQAIECLRAVKKAITYKGDDLIYKMPEYWANVKEILTAKQDDCDGGGTLLYVACRLKGIPANRLACFCGTVVGGGHFWVGYKPEEYPLNWAFLDWCYWYNPGGISARNKFTVGPDNKLHEYKADGTKVSSNYTNMWFCFNENKSFKFFKSKIAK
jgi:hypothetical protein